MCLAAILGKQTVLATPASRLPSADRQSGCGCGAGVTDLGILGGRNSAAFYGSTHLDTFFAVAIFKCTEDTGHKFMYIYALPLIEENVKRKDTKRNESISPGCCESKCKWRAAR